VASLEGTVTDPSGAILPGAALTLRKRGDGVNQARAADSRGYFLFNLVPPRSYKRVALKCSNAQGAPGFFGADRANCRPD